MSRAIVCPHCRKELEQIVWVVLSPGTQAYDLRRREWGVTEHESFKLITR